MITGLVYDRPTRSHPASILKDEGNGTLLVVVWPSIPEGQPAAESSVVLYRVRQVNSPAEFNWENLDQHAGYYISA